MTCTYCDNPIRDCDSRVKYPGDGPEYMHLGCWEQCGQDGGLEAFGRELQAEEERERWLRERKDGDTS